VEGTFDWAILLEYIEGGTLWDAIKRDEQNKQKERTEWLKRYRRWAAEVVEAMSFMHEKKVVFRDLKPDNVLLKPLPNRETTYCCLTDWTFARSTDEATMLSVVGASFFAAPETPKPPNPNDLDAVNPTQEAYTPYIDVFSFGKMLLAMMGCTRSQNIIRNNAFPKNFPETAKKLVEKTTTKTLPETRGSFKELKEDPFFKEAAFGDEMRVEAIDFELLVKDATKQRDAAAGS